MKTKKETLKEKFKVTSNNFKNFAFKGSAIDIAIGMMVGATVTSVVNSIIKDIINPPIAKLLSGIDFSQRYLVLGKEQFDSLEAAQASGAVVFTYGNFINAVIAFLITSLVLFSLVVWIGKLNKKEETAEEEKTKKCQYCMSEIDKDASRCPFCTSELKK